MEMLMPWSPALKLMEALSPRAGSQVVGRPNKLPNGGMLPGSRPVSCSTSSRVAKRMALTARAVRVFLLSSLRSAGKTSKRNSLPALMTRPLAPLARDEPRTAAASSLVKTGAWRSTVKGAPAVWSFVLSRSKTLVDMKGSLGSSSPSPQQQQRLIVLELRLPGEALHLGARLLRAHL